MSGAITEAAIRNLPLGRVLMCGRLQGFGVSKSAKRGKVRFFVRVVGKGLDIRKTVGNHPQMSAREARQAAKRALVILAKASATQPPALARGLSGRATSLADFSAAEPREPCSSSTTTAAFHESQPRQNPRHKTTREKNDGLLDKNPDLSDILEVARHAAHNAIAEAGLDRLLDLLGNSSRSPPPKSSPTLHSFAKQYVFPHWLGLADNTQRAYRNLWNVAIAPHWAQTPLHRITAPGLTDWFASLRGRKQTANQALVLLNGMLKRAKKRSLIDAVPKPEIIKYRVERRDGLSERQLARLMARLEGLIRTQPTPHLWAIITILNTGERREACVSLRLDEVDFERCEIRRSRKGGRVEAIPMTDYAAEFLRLIRPTDGGYFFPSKLSRSGHINGQSLLRWYKRLCVELGIQTAKGKPPVIHELRHTWASTLARNGVALAHIQQLLGQRSLHTTMRYVHGDRDAARLAACQVTQTRVALPQTMPQRRRKDGSELSD